MTNWNAHTELMKNAVSSTLENITFSVVEECPDDMNLKIFESTISYLSIKLPDTSLHVSLSLPTLFLSEIVENLYPGVDKNDTAYQSDTLNELSNTICGNYFRRLEGELGSFELGIPNISGESELEKLVTYRYLIDDQYPIELTITV